MDRLKKTIFQLFCKYEKNFISIRNHIHTHPELSFREFKTSAFIAEKLRKYNIPFKKGFVKTGILGIIEGKNPHKKTIAIRADMDALALQENKNHKICSAIDGIMHACGHDMHTACLLGTARILNELKNEFEGTILLVFQPAEEKLPGGAKLMIEEGIFDEKKPDWIIGLHVDPELKTGEIGFRPGMYMASCDEIYIHIKGKGGHAAAPHKIDDTVLAASSMIVEMQQIISRKCPPDVPSVLSFGRIIANGATNIIPNRVEIHGTFRSMDEKWRKQGHKLIKKIADHNAAMFDITCRIDLRVGYPCLMNNKAYTLQAKQWTTDLWSKKAVLDIDLRMGGEDFSYFAQAYPATFFRIGVCPPTLNQLPGGLHSPNFFPDEKAIKIGVNTFAWLALSFLKKSM